MSQSVLAPTTSKRLQTFAPGEKLQDRYRIVRQLGAGGMGAVYEAIDQRLQVTVAIKETFAVDQRLRRQFEQEARLLAQLNHPALPRVSDYFSEDGRAFLVMQFIAGDDLAQVIAERRQAFPPQQVIAWADQLLDALIYLHTRDRQIVHRDIKPHNLKITEAGQIALLDFGLAKTHTPDQSTTHSSHSLFGYSRRYSPLEQMQDQGTSPQSDIYALGATLYHLLTGEKPPDALLRASMIAEGKPDPLRGFEQHYPSLGAGTAALLHKAMAIKAADRFASAFEFREALRQLGRDPRGSASSVNATKVNDTRGSTSTRMDPFDSYSILKPSASGFGQLPARRWPSVVLVILGIAAVIMAASFPTGLIKALAQTFVSANAPVSHISNAVAVKPANPDGALVKPSTPHLNQTSVSLTAAPNRQDAAKKHTRRSPLKPASVNPPPISIAPAP